MTLDLYIFDWNFNILGEVSSYKSLKIARNEQQLSILTLELDVCKDNVDKLRDGLILTTQKNPELGYEIKHVGYKDEEGDSLVVIATSINRILGTRSIIAQQTFNGQVETVLRELVNKNAITPANPRRVIPNLRLGAVSGIVATIDEVTVGDRIDDFLYSMCKKHDFSFDILMNHKDKKFDFVIWRGIDRSIEQSVNPHVIFSKEFDNVISQNYIKETLNTRTTAMITGEEEYGVTRYATINDNLSGLDRIELYVDASSIKSKYNDEYGRAMFLTPSEYIKALEGQGARELEEFKDVMTLESEVDPFGQYKYGVHYFLGDKVSVRNDDLSLIMNTRVTSATEEYKKEGYTLSIEFGSKIPKLFDKIKKAVR